jgi:hypothetical protein
LPQQRALAYDGGEMQLTHFQLRRLTFVVLGKNSSAASPRDLVV